MSDDALRRLAEVIHARRTADADSSYTRRLLDGGAERCAKKLGEEAVELIIAAAAEDDASVKAEAADLLYHLIVLLEARGIALDGVLRELEGRMGTSGLEEKAGRADRTKP